MGVLCKSAEARIAVLLVPPYTHTHTSLTLYESQLNNGFPLIMYPTHSL